MKRRAIYFLLYRGASALCEHALVLADHDRAKCRPLASIINQAAIPFS